MSVRSCAGILILATYLATLALVRADEPVAIGSRRELMVDDHLIDSLGGGAELRLHHPTPREVVIVHDQPWEGNTSGYYTVLQDGGLYRMYYRGHQFVVREDKFEQAQREVTCYAESKDGTHWTKPSLGLFEFNGSKENNIILDGVGTHNFTPFIDTNPTCKPDEKYKGLGGVSDGLYVFKSTDGVHWMKLRDKPVITKGAFDSQNVGFWSPVYKKYVAYFRTFTTIGGKGYRSVAMTTSSDLLEWTTPVDLQYPGSPAEELYTNQVLPYYRAPHILVGFPTRYVARPETAQVKTLEPLDLRSLLLKAYQRCGTDITDGLFMTSRDGIAFKRWGEAFIRPGIQQEGKWIYGDMYQGWGLVETTWNPTGGGEPFPEVLHVPNELSMYVSEGSWRDKSTRLRRYTLRIDGFVSVHAPLGEAEFVTKPLTFAGETLEINYSTSAAGSIRVELQDPDGRPIKGFTLADCPEIYGDRLDQTVHWTSGPSVASLSGKPVRLRFVLSDADVYSFRFH